MNKILPLALLCLFFSSATDAQIKKGSLLLGGDISFSKNKGSYDYQPSYDYSTKGLTLNPSLGVAIKENTIVGAGLSYGKTWFQSSNSNSDRKSDGKGAQLYIRKYMPLGKGFYLFGQSGAYVNKSKDEETFFITNNRRTTTNETYGINLFPGVSYIVNRRFQLEIGLSQLVNISYFKRDYNNTDVTQPQSSEKGFGLFANASPGSSLYVGLRFLLLKS